MHACRLRYLGNASFERDQNGEESKLRSYSLKNSTSRYGRMLVGAFTCRRPRAE